MEELMTMIGNMGFPIAITGFLLIRMESRMENLSESINNLSKHIEQMN